MAIMACLLIALIAIAGTVMRAGILAQDMQDYATLGCLIVLLPALAGVLCGLARWRLTR